MAEASRVEAVERALGLLQCFHAPDEALSLAQLAQRSTLSKSTILRLASSLMRMGFLRRDQGRFGLGPELARLGAMARPEADLEGLIRPVLRDLAEGAGETSSFYVRDGDTRICRFRHNAERDARHHLEEGSRHPLDQGAAGLVLSAFAGASGERADQVRRQGAAISIGDRNPDLAAVAVPLRGADGRVLGALTVSGLASRFGPDRIEHSRRALLAAAAALAPRLPHGPGPQ